MLRLLLLLISISLSTISVAENAAVDVVSVAPESVAAATGVAADAGTQPVAKPAHKPLNKFNAVDTQPPLSAGNAITVFSSLLLVLVLMLGLAWVMRRVQFAGNNSAGAINLISQISIGTREKIVLVRVGEENVLVGCSASGVNRLHSWDSEQAPAGTETAAGTKTFGAALQSVLANRGSVQ